MSYALASIDLPTDLHSQEHIATMTVNGCAWEIHWPFDSRKDGTREDFLRVMDEGEEVHVIDLPSGVYFDGRNSWFSARYVVAYAAYELLSDYGFTQGGPIWSEHSSWDKWEDE